MVEDAAVSCVDEMSSDGGLIRDFVKAVAGLGQLGEWAVVDIRMNVVHFALVCLDRGLPLWNTPVTSQKSPAHNGFLREGSREEGERGRGNQREITWDGWKGNAFASFGTQ